MRVEALPADDGDCLWIEWACSRKTHRMLIDGGRRAEPLASRLARQPVSERHFDLVMCTHIDADHIGGLLPLVDDPPEGVTIDDFWFNGRDHLGDVLGPAQGDRLSAALKQSKQKWNHVFNNGPVVAPAEVKLHGMKVTVLSPTREGLTRLARAWPRVIEAASESAPAMPDHLNRPDPDRHRLLEELAARPFQPDLSAANGSSIAVLLEHDDGTRLLLTADAHADVLAASLKARGETPCRIDLAKVPHHGSRHSVSRDLLDQIDCQNWLFCTSGARHGHPNREAVARIVCRPDQPTLWFNYRTATTELYANEALDYRFTTGYPAEKGVTLSVSKGRVSLEGGA